MIDSRVLAPLRFEILGEVRVLRAGDVVDLGPAKQRAVLAVLLVQAGRPVPTHQIVDAVWGDDPPENGANVVQKYVAGLRRVLDPDRAPRTPGELIALTGNGYLLRVADGTLDADEFAAAVSRATAERAAGRLAEAADGLRTALTLWRGDALAGLTGPVFDAARTRLAEAHATAWEKWAEIELTRGRQTALIPDLARLVGEFPLREGLRAHLMVALHQDGRQAEALAVYRDAREYFLDEVGAEPGERMQEAHRRILRGETFHPEPATPTAPPIPSPIPVQRRPPAPPPPPPPFGGPPRAPLMPLRPAPRRRVPVGEVIAAALLPIALCSFGGWIYFAYAGVRRKDPHQLITAGVYGFVFAVVVFLMAIDPSPIETDTLSEAEGYGTLLAIVASVVAAIHGAVVASHPGDTPQARALREQARRYVAFDPANALRIGIGRPNLMRAYDDGGLVDLNHAWAPELTETTGLSPEQAHRITIDRIDRGPYRQPADLVARRLLTPKDFRRIESRLVCVPPDPWANQVPVPADR
ncbi:BTAD domain-containing putative transcriptional regulator [Micromonosporaceae bacterium Da 78-11]